MAVRRRVFRVFMEECRPGPDARVADFGVSGLRDQPVHHFFESLYPYTNRLTAIAQAAERASWYADQFPGLTFLEADLRSIPLPDNYFDAGVCNAVVEHAGPRREQQTLVHEVCRVCRCVLFTTPNARFPIELHTLLPIAHWLPDPAFRRSLRALGLNFLAQVDNLNLLTASEFMALFPQDRFTLLLGSGPLALRPNLICVSRAVP
jgi:hypothetical protein